MFRVCECVCVCLFGDECGIFGGNFVLCACWPFLACRTCGSAASVRANQLKKGKQLRSFDLGAGSIKKPTVGLTLSSVGLHVRKHELETSSTYCVGDFNKS